MPRKKEQKIKGVFIKDNLYLEESDQARDLYNQSAYGSITEKKVHLSLMEGFYLFQKDKIIIYDGKNKEMSEEQILKRIKRLEPNFTTRYVVFKDLRERGYVVKTALKFGADFRVYDRGIKPGDDHAKWVVFPVKEGSTMTWHDFSAKNRVAHSTKKKLLLGITDDEADVTYYEITWVRP